MNLSEAREAGYSEYPPCLNHSREFGSKIYSFSKKYPEMPLWRLKRSIFEQRQVLFRSSRDIFDDGREQNLFSGHPFACKSLINNQIYLYSAFKAVWVVSRRINRASRLSWHRLFNRKALMGRNIYCFTGLIRAATGIFGSCWPNTSEASQKRPGIQSATSPASTKIAPGNL